ncbi:MAG TPA: DNA alkylation repair protein [Candidatus Omnitrophota bacterium]|nr:DNA alkylation repair protein [Candidatus Omnitrophota bacterium]HNQ50376.1 DNA alkylation repair protein [Candidatus Omnitrophota bacterium]HQO37728.1 DNA alkylation repair protein [Candidatus Omnitrophota bacterium]HQQ05929.1 DNA alkylation repair protein [Candidatus Omnitrophota bacterium]
MDQIILDIRAELKKKADAKIREGARRYFKEPIKCYGMMTAAVAAIAKGKFTAIRARSKAQIFGLCEELWQSGYMEEGYIACAWAYNLRKDFEPADITVFRKWVNAYVSNWASCDTLCNHTVGAFIEMYPASVAALKKWARSKNRWMRRAAAVSLIIPARRGKFLKDIFEIADILLLDQEDLVQKGYGWMLKAAGEAHPQEVFEYVCQRKARMPRTALRCAIEKLPAALKAQAMEKS